MSMCGAEDPSCVESPEIIFACCKQRYYESMKYSGNLEIPIPRHEG
jgi:hypothetical protein